MTAFDFVLEVGKRQQTSSKWYCREALRLPPVKEAIFRCWQEVPGFPREWSPERMAKLFAKLCRLMLQHFCPPATKVPIKQWITAETWELVQWSAEVRNACFNARRAARRLFLYGPSPAGSLWRLRRSWRMSRWCRGGALANSS